MLVDPDDKRVSVPKNEGSDAQNVGEHDRESPTTSYSRSSSFSGSASHDKQTWDELESIQRQFERMELNRRQKVNLLKQRKSQQLRAEYRVKVKDEHIRSVQQRRLSMDSAKQQERRSVADRKQRKRDSRLRLLETVGTNALKFGHSFERHHKSVCERRKSVLERREQIQQEKDEKKKREFMQKQKKRDKRIRTALHRKHSSTTTRPKSACTSFLFDEKDKENILEISEDLSSESPSDLSSSFCSMMGSGRRASTANKLNRSMSASFVQFADSELVEKPKSTLKSLFRSKRKKKRSGSYGFMKPTLSAYLCTNNPSTMFANC